MLAADRMQPIRQGMHRARLEADVTGALPIGVHRHERAQHGRMGNAPSASIVHSLGIARNPAAGNRHQARLACRRQVAGGTQGVVLVARRPRNVSPSFGSGAWLPCARPQRTRVW